MLRQRHRQLCHHDHAGKRVVYGSSQSSNPGQPQSNASTTASSEPLNHSSSGYLYPKPTISAPAFLPKHSRRPTSSPFLSTRRRPKRPSSQRSGATPKTPTDLHVPLSKTGFSSGESGYKPPEPASRLYPSRPAFWPPPRVSGYLPTTESSRPSG
ncbi:hypothetical protein N658DRAFT_495380 [Parathielavia hyrcaniae]|uniref:Uncharacterized protein n=1 Tax=Parathielavia hyrcaniae TaxID=113614 RepID=A0AAN6Q354_9PEZI|nr:hypothetical protein N658DRAFT_495380 [Parathielavia hyrcaniae]